MANPDNDAAKLANELLDRALQETGAADPRELHRTRLRELRHVNSDGYEEAVSHYRARLVPMIAEGKEEPLSAWTEYGRLIAELIVAGEAVSVGPDGMATPYSAPAGLDELVLHLPSGKGRALVVATPVEPSPAQDATRALLADGRHSLPT